MDPTPEGLRIGPSSGAFGAEAPVGPEADYAAYVVRLEEQIATHSPALDGGDGAAASDGSETCGEAER